MFFRGEYIFVSSYFFRGGGGIDIYIFLHFFLLLSTSSLERGVQKMLSRGCVIFPHILNGLGYFFAYFFLLS